MGSDLHLSPPTEAEFKIVHSHGHTAFYSRQTDGIYGSDRTDNWERTYHAADPDQVAAKALAGTRRSVELLIREDFEDLPETLPRAVLEARTELEMHAARLERDLASVRSRIKAGETTL